METLNDLEVLYQDDHLIAINKPCYLLSVPGRGPDKQDSVASRVIDVYKTARVVHRLDWATSGVMILALNKNAQRELNWQFERRQTEKTYLTKVYGHFPYPQGVINIPMICDWENRPRQRVDFELGKSAITAFKRLSVEDERSKLMLKPSTGRSHQLRIHMKFLGHAIVGDRLYASEEHYPERESCMYLHAEELVIQHPVNGQRLALSCPCSF